MARPGETPEEESRGSEVQPSGDPADTSAADVGAEQRAGVRTAFTILVLVLLGSLAIVFIPRAWYAPAPTSPPVGLVLGVGVGVTAISSAAVYGVLAFRKRFWPRVVILTVVYGAVIALVLFALWPETLHDFTLNEALTRDQLSSGLVFTAISSFLLYAVATLVIYRSSTKRVQRVLGRIPAPALLTGLFLFLGSATILAVLLVSAVIAAGAPFTMIGAGGLFGLAIVVGLVASIILELAAFRAAEKQVVSIRNASVLAGLFWVALAILAGYHIAWVIYVLWLTSTWPLKAPSGC